ncbi:uncharacterized protein LOC122441515 isoform X2 [Cervus canadensis]|uniref:uncharacterized protein LOC122441515 isoform X2 n=1 Tax=Cervus canadensis TaxID=1574408 RepID=UPI001C9E67DC|nr:uncharacterized protein LOC122441515 isoform X2 [Cervus canadensis]
MARSRLGAPPQLRVGPGRAGLCRAGRRLPASPAAGRAATSAPRLPPRPAAGDPRLATGTRTRATVRQSRGTVTATPSLRPPQTNRELELIGTSHLARPSRQGAEVN